MAEEARRALTRALLALALATAALTTGAAGPQKNKPAWAELTVDQQQVLGPLKGEWDTLSAFRKKTWIGIANRYPSLTAQEQQRVQTRMQKWAKLTPEQRDAARERYKSIGKLPPEKRDTLTQRWAEYQALPPTEKRALDTPPAGTERRRKPRPPAAPQSTIPKSSPTAK